jgi:hypothetical protein
MQQRSEQLTAGETGSNSSVPTRTSSSAGSHATVGVAHFPVSKTSSSPLDALGAISKSVVRTIRRVGNHSTSSSVADGSRTQLVLNNNCAGSQLTTGRNFGCRIIVDDKQRHEGRHSSSWKATLGGQESGFVAGGARVAAVGADDASSSTFGCDGLFSKVTHF